MSRSGGFNLQFCNRQTVKLMSTDYTVKKYLENLEKMVHSFIIIFLLVRHLRLSQQIDDTVVG